MRAQHDHYESKCERKSGGICLPFHYKSECENKSPDFYWLRGSTGVERYGCIPRSAANNLGEIPQKNGSSKSPCFKEFFRGGTAEGLIPSRHPHSLGYACTLYAPTSPLPILVFRPMSVDNYPNFDTEYDRTKVPPYNGNDPRPPLVV